MSGPGSTSRDIFDNEESQLRYEAYSRLQAAAVAFGDSFSLPIPEIVAIGGQSDGKSSLMEAFLGVSPVPCQADSCGGEVLLCCGARTLLCVSDHHPHTLLLPLQFRFNVREVEMGTRRPLIVQMVHDPTALEPRCRLQEEDSEEYGPPIMPETAVADAIMKRTKEHLRQLGNAAVSSKPIVMRAE
jgi:hypothetical protein